MMSMQKKLGAPRKNTALKRRSKSKPAIASAEDIAQESNPVKVLQSKDVREVVRAILFLVDLESFWVAGRSEAGWKNQIPGSLESPLSICSREGGGEDSPMR